MNEIGADTRGNTAGHEKVGGTLSFCIKWLENAVVRCGSVLDC